MVLLQEPLVDFLAVPNRNYEHDYFLALYSTHHTIIAYTIAPEST